MKQIKFILILFIALFFVLAGLGLTFATPADTYAHPAYGFTPQPPPPPPGGGGGGGSDDGDKPGSGGGGGDEPTDTVIVEIDRCDLSCSVDYVEAGGSEGLLASVDGGYVSAQNHTVSSGPLPDVEVLVPVKLIHQGSGFIVEQTISDSGSTTISVPYPGQWEVLMVNAPQFVTNDMMNMTGLNLAQLQADLANNPVSLGVVEANAGRQLVECPLECVIETTPEEFYLPETGAANNTPFVISIGFLLIIISLSIFAVFRAYRKFSQ